MKQMYVFLSHQLTQEQRQEAETLFGIDRFIYLPKELQQLWSDVPANLPNLDEYISPFFTYIKQNLTSCDIILLQGEVGMVYCLVSFCKSFGIKTYYATTNRIAVELQEGKNIIKKSLFKHGRFREYGCKVY